MNRLAAVAIFMIIALLGMLYVDQARADASPIIKPETLPLKLGGVAYRPVAINALALIDTQTHTTIDTLDMTHYGCYGPKEVRLNPNSAELYVMCGSSENIVVLETSSLSLVASIETCSSDIAFTHSGAYGLSVNDCNRQIDVIDTSAHTIVQSIPHPDYAVNSITAHPYLPLAYAGAHQCCWSGYILVIDTNTFAINTIISYGGNVSRVSDVQTSPDGQWLYASEYYGQGLAKVDVSTNTIVDTLPGYGRYGLDISPDGSVIYTSEGWSVSVIEAANLEVITSINVGASSQDHELTCDGSELYLAQYASTIQVIDTQTYTITYDIPLPGMGNPYGIAICPQYGPEGAYLDPPSQSQYAEAGETITYTLQVVNLTGETDSFDLEVLPGNTWETTLSKDQVGPIEDRESITFTAQVEVPAGVQPWDHDSATIQATSVTSPSLTATAKLNTTTASNELAYVPSGDTLLLINTQAHTNIGTIDLAQYGCQSARRARLTPNGAELYVSCENSHNIVILETTNLSLVATIDQLNTCNQDIAFVQFGVFALSTESTGGCGGVYQIDVIDTATHTIIQSIPLPDYTITSIAAHPSLPLAYVAGYRWGEHGIVYVIDTNTFTIQTTITLSDMLVQDVQASPDGQWLYASYLWLYGAGGIAKIDINTNTIVDTSSDSEKHGLDISPDGSKIYASGGYSGTSSSITVIDAASLDNISYIDVESTYENELTCDGRELYVASQSSSIPVIDTQTYNISYEIPGSSSGYGIAICPQYVAEGVYLIPPEQAKTGGHGKTVTYQETLFNNSGTTETFTLAVTSTWTATLPVTSTGELKAGEMFTFLVVVNIPPEAKEGDQDVALITATSVNDPEVSASAEATTTAVITTYLTNLPIVSKN